MIDELGTPSYRLKRLLEELAKRFPDVNNHVMSDPPEPKYLAEIDALIEIKNNIL